MYDLWTHIWEQQRRDCLGGIFISYRREDAQGEALHLRDDLKAHFGNDRVFLDVTGIDPGKDFRKAIESAVTTCDELIVMIGRVARCC